MNSRLWRKILLINRQRIINNIGIIGTDELISSNHWPAEREIGGLFDVLENANLVRDSKKKSHQIDVD